jgi:pseudomonalisin
VRNYLSKQGFASIKTTPNGLFVTATGTVAQVEAAFNTTLTWFKQNNASIYVNTTPAQVPSNLNGIVISVLGLNNVSAIAKTETQCTISSPTCVRLEYDPASYWNAYHVGTVPAASNATIAVMAEGDVSQVPKDLVTFEQSMSLPQVPVTVVPVGLWSPDTSGQDEWDLDTQYTTGMAGNAKQLYIYDTTSMTDQDTALEFNHWASDDLAVVANRCSRQPATRARSARWEIRMACRRALPSSAIPRHRPMSSRSEEQRS